MKFVALLLVVAVVGPRAASAYECYACTSADPDPGNSKVGYLSKSENSTVSLTIADFKKGADCADGKLDSLKTINCSAGCIKTETEITRGDGRIIISRQCAYAGDADNIDFSRTSYIKRTGASADSLAYYYYCRSDSGACNTAVDSTSAKVPVVVASMLAAIWAF